MGKKRKLTNLERLIKSKYFIENYQLNELPSWVEGEVDDLCSEFPYNTDRSKTITNWINLGLRGWRERFRKVKKLRGKCATLEFHILYYGEELGREKYKKSCKNRTAHFDHSSEVQRKYALISAKKTKGNPNHGIRTKGYWMGKGYSEDEALEKVREVQGTNKLSKYIKKYGEKEGRERFLKRKEKWTKRMSDPEIGKKRSLSLARYIERYGELEGRQEYVRIREIINNKRKENISRASKESIERLSPILEHLRSNGIKYFFGEESNKEWFILDKENHTFYFYDLTIPSHKTIIEYHGECFHPNPSWDDTKWNEWKMLYKGLDADTAFANDKNKKLIAEQHGWTVHEIYSSDPDDKVFDILKSMGLI